MHEAEILARVQFGVTAGFHFLYPPLSIGLGVLMVVMEGLYLRTKKPMYEQMARFYTRIFALTFAIGVATGIVLEFEFGTNWSTYSRYVGDIFGSPLAAEALFAFFLESTFLGILIFGWDKVGPKFHFFATFCVALGAVMSAFWIIVANSWMQTPAGFEIVGEGENMRAVITDFWAMVFNPSTLERYSHVLSASMGTGAFFVMSISAYYLLKKKYVDFAKASLKIALVFAILSTLLQLFTGHLSAMGITYDQPEKLAAFEGHYKTGPGTMYLVGWVDDEAEKVYGIGIPGFLSYLVYFDPEEPVVGLEEFPKEDRPSVNAVFQMYHLMISIGMLMIGIALVGAVLWFIGRLSETKWYLWILLPSFILPQLANQAGWIATEMGRQPWAVYHVLRTSDA
ncbi:MAG: cytochrome ubiquinol oxidase subunit I, partial [Bacteroidota bacterium]